MAWASSARAAPPEAPDEAARVAEHLAWRWAPVYVQHVDGDDRGADRPTRIDFDGNWDTTDNWAHQGQHGTALPPAAYGAAILTATHAYLTYTLYYPRDWAKVCLPFVCHDNDLETVQLVVERDRADGRLVEIRAKAHHAITDTPGGAIALGAGGRPLLRVEPRGHGVAVCRPGDAGCAPRAGRIVYAPGRVAGSPPAAARGQTVAYELLSIRDTLWARRHATRGELWTGGETGPLSYAGRHQGRLGHVMGASMAGSRFLGGVRPPWALKGARGRRGDWFLDPAATGRQPARYEHNPFLDDLAAECRGSGCSPAPARERTRLAYLLELGAPYVALSLGGALAGSWLRRRAGPPRSWRRTPRR